MVGVAQYPGLMASVGNQGKSLPPVATVKKVVLSTQAKASVVTRRRAPNPPSSDGEKGVGGQYPGQGIGR